MTLQIEEGKFYCDEDGLKVGPTIKFTKYSNWHPDQQPRYIVKDGDGRVWLDNGKFVGTEGFGTSLVTEWAYDPAKEALDILTNTPEEATVLEDLINSPPHYTGHPSGVECIQITEHMNFCRGNAVKYIWRAGEKNSEIDDLKKAVWYLNREIARLEK